MPTCVLNAARVAISQAIARVTTNETATSTSGISVCIPDGESGSLFATVLALNRGEFINVADSLAATAAIFVQDSIVMPPLPGEAFAKLYHLTDSEMRVLLEMSRGLGVKEVGEILGINETTVKTHVQHIHAKTGAHKQTELMYLLAGAGCQLCPLQSHKHPSRPN